MMDRKILPAVLALLFAICNTVIPADNNELSEVYYQSWLSLSKQGKNDEAAEKFTKALSYRKDFPAARFRLGDCYEKLKNDKRAVRNYRLAMKSLSENPARTRDEDELLGSVSRSLERVDLNGTRFARIKNNHISGLLALGGECLNKKYQRFTYTITESIFKIDPANKPARELSAKIDQSVVDSRKEKERKKNALVRPQYLFNGKDLSNWEVGPPDCWKITQGQLVAQPETSKAASIKWKGTPPEEFSLTLKFFIDAKNSKTINLELSFTKGMTDLGKYQFAGVYTIPKAMLRPGANQIKMSRDEKFCTFNINGKSVSEGLTWMNGIKEAPAIGFSVKGGRIQFESIVLGPLERPEAK
ncbi:MAG: hypothetical protein HZA49_00630 [Planctomycetes bacterium]|nr:hypothetical protein [Planctomycetota bacterium]